MRILLIEDNTKLAETIKASLEQQGYSVDVANTAEKGDELAVVERYDAIILDVVLADRDGVALCRELRMRVGVASASLNAQLVLERIARPPDTVSERPNAAWTTGRQCVAS